MSYNAYPLGKLPKEFQRPELDKIKELGYNWNDPRDAIKIFEEKVAAFAGAKYAVTVDCCSHALFLSLMYLREYEGVSTNTILTIPKYTYVSVPMQALHAGFKIKFVDFEWSGVYKIDPLNLYDGAVRWTKGMYVGNGALQTVSFQIKKRVAIGKGGIILTDSLEAYNALKLMSYDGRDLNLPYDHPEHVKTVGYHMYMTPEDAARGIILMDSVPEENPDSGNSKTYPDVETMIGNLKL